MKKPVSLILVAAMLLAMLPVFAASAASVQPLPVTGDKVVIYNAYGESIFGAQNSDKIKAVASVTNADGTIHFGNGGYIFTVTVSGGYYTFESKGKYLACSTETDSSGNSKEIIRYDAQQSDYTKWRLQSTAGGYIMYNKAAKYNGNSVVIEFYSGGFTGWTNNGSSQQFAMNFYKVEDPYNLGFVLNPKVNISANDAFIGMDYEFTFELDDMTSLSSLKVEYSVGAGYQTISPTMVKAKNYKATISKDVLAGKSELMLWVTAKNTYGIEYNGSAAVQIHDEPLILSVSPLPNAATTGKRPEISAAISNCGTNPKVTMTLDGAAVTPTVTASRISYTPAADLTDGSHTAALKIERSDNRKTEMTWTFFVNRAALTPYFGQVHSHTTYSDGAGTLASAYEHAMTVKDLDFLIVTDHSNYFDTSSSATTTSYYNLSSLIKSGSISKWEEARKTAAEYNAKSSDFICAYGYEMTWSGGPGHTNTFNTYGTVSRNNSELNNKSNYAGMYRYNDLMVNANAGLDVNGKPVTGSTRTKYIADAPVISQMNHPGTTFGTFDDYAGRTDARDEIINLIEVGNGSGAVVNSSYFPSYSEYDKALAKGWHIAPTNNQDNHSGRWGSSNTHRTVVLTDDFTEAGLYRAMAQRRVYATEDQNLRIFYYLNNQVMGSVVNAGKTVDIAVSLSDPDGERLGKVEIIGENGKTLKTYTAAGSTYELNDTIDNTDAYYYIKVTETDGDIAVTAPVWIGGETQECTTHSWNSGEITQTATCTESGIKTYTCTVCGATTTEEVAAPGHHFVGGVCTQCGEKEPDEPVKPCDGGKDCPSYDFVDVKYSSWYHEAVDFAVTKNLFKGMTATTFEPNTPMTRGMLVTVLWRYNDEPRQGTNFFADVKDGQWYTDAIAWASHNGIVGGVGNGRFDPDGKVTREQLAAILYRYSGADGARRGSYAGYPDADSVSSWAADAYAWAIGEGLISGNLINGKTMLDPQGSATRAQVAIILMRYIQNQ